MVVGVLLWVATVFAGTVLVILVPAWWEEASRRDARVAPRHAGESS